jgi:hypothetical protein
MFKLKLGNHSIKGACTFVRKHCVVTDLYILKLTNVIDFTYQESPYQNKRAKMALDRLPVPSNPSEHYLDKHSDQVS